MEIANKLEGKVEQLTRFRLRGTRQSSCRFWNCGFIPQHTESSKLISEKTRKVQKPEEKKEQFFSSGLILRTYQTAPHFTDILVCDALYAKS